MLFLPPNQQRQSTEGILYRRNHKNPEYAWQFYANMRMPHFSHISAKYAYRIFFSAYIGIFAILIFSVFLFEPRIAHNVWSTSTLVEIRKFSTVSLRPRPHNFMLTAKNRSTTECDFITRMIFKVVLCSFHCYFMYLHSFLHVSSFIHRYFITFGKL